MPPRESQPEIHQIPEPRLIAPETVEAKQEKWRALGYTEDEIKELTSKLERLVQIKDRLQEFLGQSDEWYNAHPKEKAEMEKERLALIEEAQNIKEKIESLQEVLAQRKQKEEEAKRGEEPKRRRKEIEERRARGEMVTVFTETHEDPKTKEKREITLDLEQELLSSREFYQTHNLSELAAALPEEITLSPESEARLREAMRQGFDRVMILPDHKTQSKAGGIVKLKEELADKELPGLSDADQYTASYLSDEVSGQSQIRLAKRKKAYLLLYQSGPIPNETKGKSFSQAEKELDKLFGKGKWNGLTLEEYLLLQRKECEERKDHSFDAYSTDASKSQWTWLLDSRVPSGWVGASWSPGIRRVRVDWYGPGYSYSYLGARPAVVVKL